MWPHDGVDSIIAEAASIKADTAAVTYPVPCMRVLADLSLLHDLCSFLRIIFSPFERNYKYIDFRSMPKDNG